jgi:GNAT superfamily N-acetyltransferase
MASAEARHMGLTVLIEDSRLAPTFADSASIQPPTPDAIIQDGPDSHWSLVDCHGTCSACCSLWWRNTPAFRNHQVGIVGHYWVSNAMAAERMLRHACAQLRRNGCTLVVGPMNGNTWRPYRLITEFGTEPTFFLEPDNPTTWPGHFVDHGFESLAEYFSAVNCDLEREDRLVKRVADDMSALGVQIRILDRSNFEADMRRIHAIGQASFRHNLLFTGIDEEEFLRLYRPLRSVADYDTILIAECQGKPVGFLFAIPDLLQAGRGAAIDTLIIKTLAILPAPQYLGLGSLLLDRIRITARRKGYTRLIHALVRDGRHLRRTTARYAKLMRRYTLYAKELG